MLNGCVGEWFLMKASSLDVSVGKVSRGCGGVGEWPNGC
jgi:hypothetical protein